MSSVLNVDWNHSIDPRHYPPRFGIRIAALYDDFCSSRAFWEVDPELEKTPLKTFFSILEWDDLWPDANMVSVLAWLRGNKHLQLGTWREVFPEEL